ncbi:MAG TPA: hypothetical protein PK587_08300 [Syntrophales bacterium]|nr:hypothetical protein [Syntrophales bacterium]
MAQKDKGNYSDKYPKERKTDPKVEKAVRAEILYGTMPCATAAAIAAKLDVSADEVGFTLDRLDTRITKCLLGLFGNTPVGKVVVAAESVAPELESEIRKSLQNGKLTCAAAWEISKRLRIPKIKISSACEKLGIKISSCQLGAF